MKYFILSILIFSALHAQAQDPEFPKKEFIMHLRVHTGMITRFDHAPDLFVGGLQIVPQYTMIKNRMRVGAITGGFYGNKKLQGMLGPTISFKLKTLALKTFGSAGNVNLSIDHLWGTGNQKLFGGGLTLDLLNFIVVGASLHRDYQQSNWWLQGTVAFRLSKLKSIYHP